MCLQLFYCATRATKRQSTGRTETVNWHTVKSNGRTAEAVASKKKKKKTVRRQTHLPSKITHTRHHPDQPQLSHESSTQSHDTQDTSEVTTRHQWLSRRIQGFFLYCVSLPSDMWSTALTASGGERRILLLFPLNPPSGLRRRRSGHQRKN